MEPELFKHGIGSPLVVVPGVQGRWEWFKSALDSLAENCSVTSFSLAGDFRSGWRYDRDTGFECYLRQLDAIWPGVGGRAALCGVSYGGFVALRYAARHPDRVSALILVSSPAPGWTPSARQQTYIAHPWRSAPRFVLTSPFRTWPEIRAAFDTTAQRIAFMTQYGWRAAAAPMNPGLMAARIAEQQSIDFTGDCQAVRVPTLVISGEPHLDRIVPVESTRRYESLIRGAKYVMIERTGHLGSLTRPRMFASVVSEFVRAHATDQ